MKKLICLILCFLMLPVNIFPISVSAGENTLDIPVVVKENNNKSVPASLYRRGFSLPEGKYFNTSDFGLYDANGEGIEASFEITEKYKDGSIKWALCSFVVSLKPDERKELVIKNSGATSPAKPVVAEKISEGYKISNEYIEATVTKNGIDSITYGSVGFTENIATYIKESGFEEAEFAITEVSLLSLTPVYARVMAKGTLGTIASTEIVLTVAAGAKNAEIETRVIALKQMNVSGMGVKITSGNSEFSYPYSKYDGNGSTGADYIFSTKNGVSAYFVTADIEKFRGATSAASETGFLFDSPYIYVAPVIATKSYLWHDGLTRTNHLTVSFDDNGDELSYAQKNPPSVVVDPKSFEESGAIAIAGSCAPIDRVINLAYFDLDKRNGRIDAGAIHYGIDPDTKNLSSSDAHPGEMEHNYGIAYMATGDPTLFRVMNESAEFWADVEVYKGSLKEVYGANRYRTAASYTGNRFKTSHPYYGDSSGLYMTYVLTGNEYYRDCYKAAVEHMYSNMYETSGKNCGYNYPHMKDWISGEAKTTTYSESRYMIQARPLYYAYGLFGDEKFREAALEITRWAAHTQSEDGWWYQAYHDDGRPFRQGGQTQDAVKTYIWMYGLRGISFLSRFEDTPEIRLVLSRAGKFVENEYKNFGKGLWKPTGDPNLYECDEDNTRSKGPYEDIMALELLYRAYRLTGDESYFKSILDCTETWLSSMNPGGGTVIISNMEGKGTTTQLGGGQNYTLLQIFPELRVLFKEKENRIIQLGYDYLLTAMSDGAKMYEGDIIKVGIKEPEVTQIVFEKGNDKVMFGTNQTGIISGNYTKDYETIIPEGRLWLGMENRITTPGKVTLFKHMAQFDRILARQIPVSVTALSDSVQVFVDEYSQSKIVLRAYGEGIVNFKAEDGIFPIADGKRYSVTAKRDGINGVKITICQNCINNLKVAEKSLQFKVTLSANTYIKDTESISAYSAANEGLMSLTGNNFRPDEEADIGEFNTAMAKLTGTDKVFEGTTYEDAANYVLDVMSSKNNGFFDTTDIIKKNIVAVGKSISDEDALNEAALNISLPDTLSVGDRVELPDVSVADTVIEWKADSEAVVIENNTLQIVGEAADKVEICAILKKGSATSEKNFEVNIRKNSDVMWYSNTQIVSENKHKLKAMTGDFEINFDITPKNSITNAIAGFTSSSVLTNSFSEIPIIFRFSPEGNIDAYNGTAYAAVENLKYEGGKKYKVRMNISMANKKYSVYVTPEGGREYTIATDFSFRATAPGTDEVDVVYIPTATAGSELFCISYMDCASSEQNSETVRLEKYDENGLLFGKYAREKIYLPDYTEGKKITWISSDNTVADSSGNILLEEGTAAISLYGIKGKGDYKNCVDLLRYLGLTELEDNGLPRLTRAQAAEILCAVRYMMISE